VSGSLRQPAHGLKARLARQGLEAAGLALAPGLAKPGHAVAVLAAVGDPMQALAAGLVLELAPRGVPVLLAGGSQMAAVLALALALAAPEQRGILAAAALVATTAWVVEEPGSDLALLLSRIGAHWGVEPRLQAAALRFNGCRRGELRDYERGYVKEGVGAGGVALLWQIAGRDPAALAQVCDRDCALLHA